MNTNNDTLTECKNTARTQIHNGPGDNVGRDKIVNQPISPKAFQAPIKSILTNLRYRQPSQAKDQLSTLKATSALDVDVEGILDIIQLLLCLFGLIGRYSWKIKSMNDPQPKILIKIK